MHAFIAYIMEIRKINLLFLILGTCLQIQGQKRWDGGAGDGLWATAANWVGDIVPSAGDDVLLDHSGITGNYIVTLPSGMSAITVKTLVINPTGSQKIEVVLPVSNAALPGFTATGPGYGLEIHDGGVFRNSSGASAGTPVDISDSIKIQNGGLYIHNTSRAHAGNVMVLSKAAGTEQGSFEFDVPGGSGYTVSIAGRVYGNMILSAVAAGGTKSYTSTGTTTVNINGQFRMNAGVNYSLNFNGGFIIHGDFVHQGNIFDISSGSHSNRISLRKNLSQSGLITESGTGLPVLEFDGANNQDISFTGTITQSNTVRINNAAGITLQNPLSISYRMEFIKGNIRTTSVNLLIMQDNASYTGGSPNSFVEGPMRKLGDDDFEFPIGKQGDYAPLVISGTGGGLSDEFEAEYFLGKPAVIFGSSIESPPLVRISSLEYWRLERLAGASSKKISLAVRTYSNATLLDKLVVSRWDLPANIWKNEGNTAYSGIATGTITSGDIHSFGVFTIASTVIDQNPLPVTSISFNAGTHGEHAVLMWQIDPALQAESFEILRSDDNIHFVRVQKIDAFVNKIVYRFSEKISVQGLYYYKVKMIAKNGSIRYTVVRSIIFKQNGIQLLVPSPLINHSHINITVRAPDKAAVNIFLINVEGKIIRKFSTVSYNGSVNFLLDISGVAAGIYYVTAVANGIKANVVRIVKL
jgi:hypothetical protein